MGFSPWGLGISLAVLAPTFLLWVLPPRSPLPQPRVPGVLAVLERSGQALCLVVPAVTLPGAMSVWWAVPGGLALVAYYALWARYVVERTPDSLYRRTWALPVPMAALPVLVYLAASGLLGNPFIAASAVVLAAGHVPASLIIAKELRTPPDRRAL